MSCSSSGISKISGCPLQAYTGADLLAKVLSLDFQGVEELVPLSILGEIQLIQKLGQQLGR